MQETKAGQLRREWSGDECPHPAFDRLYYLGAHTEDWACTACGCEFTKQEYGQLMASRESVDQLVVETQLPRIPLGPSGNT